MLFAAYLIFNLHYIFYLAMIYVQAYSDKRQPLTFIFNYLYA